jgi:hypothetical protein
MRPRCASKATPITFQFDAQVTTVTIVPPFQLPFSVAAGDTIHGRFSFEPYPAGNFGVQQTLLHFDVGGVALQSSIFEITEAFNQYPPHTPEDNGVLGMPTDSLHLNCLLSGCSPLAFPGRIDLKWRPYIDLSGESPILSQFLDLTGDLRIWNNLPQRSLVLDLYDQFGGARIDALVGHLTSTPEPSTLSLAGIPLLFACISLPGRLRRLLRTFCVTCLSAAFVTIASSSCATPITFEFDASIAAVPPEFVALNLPYSLSVGQTIDGSYLFDSAQDLLDVFLHPELGKKGQISLAFAGNTVGAPVNTGLVDDANLYLPPVPGLKSSIELSYESPTNVALPFDTVLRLQGPPGTITSIDDVLDVTVWNKLTTTRRLELRYLNPQSGQSIVAVASVGDVRAVPEPSSASMILEFTSTFVLFVMVPAVATAAGRRLAGARDNQVELT